MNSRLLNIFIIGSLLLLFTTVRAQNPEIEKLYKNLFDNRYSKPDTALYFGNLLLKKTTSEKPDTIITFVYEMMGDAAWYKESYFLSMGYYQKAYDNALKTKDLKNQNRNMLNIGYLEMEIGKYDDAIKHLIKVSEAAFKSKKIRLLYTATGYIASTYTRMGDNHKAIRYHKESIEIAIKNNFGEESLANCYNNIANNYSNMGQLDTAMYYYDLAYKMNMSVNDLGGAGGNLVNIANCHIKMNRLENAFTELTKAKKMFKKEGIENSHVFDFVFGNYYVAKKDYKNARSSFLDAYNKASKSGSKAALSEVVYKLKDVSLLGNDYKNAFKYIEEYHELLDSMDNIVNRRDAANLEAQFQNEKKTSEIKFLNKEQKLKDAQLSKQKTIQVLVSVVAIVLLLLLVVGGYAYKNIRKSRALIQMQKAKVDEANEELHQQNEEIAAQRDEIETQKKIVDEKNSEIVDSIRYAERIQKTILPDKGKVDSVFSENFILFKPKDIVSGDFYWACETEDSFYLAICDSTGHGVPGAFMSLLNVGFLSEAINEKKIRLPGEVFNYVRESLINSISKDGQQDGFDGILLCLDSKSKTITYAASNNAPLIVSGNTINYLPCDKMPVGKGVSGRSFNTYAMEVKKGDSIYLFTDGYADQFGGPKGKKFKYKPLEEILLTNTNLPMDLQHEILDNKFADWKGYLEQVDDVCIVGIRI